MLGGRKVVAFDLDNVLCDYDQAIVKAVAQAIRDGDTTRFIGGLKEYLGESLELEEGGLEEQLQDVWSFDKSFSPSSSPYYDYIGPVGKEWVKAFLWTKVEFWEDMPEVKGMVELVRKCQAAGMHVVFVTSREPHTSVVNGTAAWLESRGIASSVIFTHSRGKGLACTAIGADCFIDDVRQNCIDVLRTQGTATKVMLWKRAYNRLNGDSENVGNRYIIECESVYEVAKVIGVEAAMSEEVVQDAIRKQKLARTGVARRRGEGAVVFNSPPSTRRSGARVHGGEEEVREEQLAFGHGMDTVCGRNGEAYREVAGGGGSGERLRGESPSARNREFIDGFADGNVVSGGGRQGDLYRDLERTVRELDTSSTGVGNWWDILPQNTTTPQNTTSDSTGTLIWWNPPPLQVREENEEDREFWYRAFNPHLPPNPFV